MNGGPELILSYLDPGSGSMLLGLVAPLLILGVVVTIWALVDAIQRNQTGWWVGMLVGWLFGLGWLVALIYLLAIRPGLARSDTLTMEREVIERQQPVQAPQQSPGARSVAEELQALVNLSNQGILTAAEFEQQKARLLS